MSTNSSSICLKAVISERASSDWPSWLMVFEWEDVFSQQLSLEVVAVGSWVYARKDALGDTGYYLCFLQLAKELELFEEESHVIPIVMDVWKQDLDGFIRNAVKFRQIFLTSFEMYRILLARGCPNIVYLPYSIPDCYVQQSVPEKDIDLIQYGRTNPVLDHFVAQFLRRFPQVNYVTTQVHNGKIHFHSSLHGLQEVSDTRKKFMEYVGRSKISLVSTAGMDGSRDTGGVNSVSPRFFESAAGFCRIVGRFPRNDEFEVLGFNAISDRVDSYQEFENLILEYLRKPFDREEEYRNLLVQHTTSNRSHIIRNSMQMLQGLRASCIRNTAGAGL